MKTELHNMLAHLSPEQVEMLIRRYYAGEKTTDLITEYNLSCRPNQLYKALPPEILSNETCPHCNASMLRDRLSRSFLYMINPAYCPSCGHRDDTKCACERCIYMRLSKNMEKLYGERRAVQGYCRSIRAKQPVHAQCADLSLRRAVSLLALIRSCTVSDLPGEAGIPRANNFVILEPLSGATVPFTPNKELQKSLLADMGEAGLIKISDQSDLSAFGFNDGCLETYYSEQVRWLLDIENAKELIIEIEFTASCRDAWPDSWHDQVHELWFDIAFAEALAFYKYMAAERGLPESGEKATQLMLRNLLQSYSVAQCCRVIWTGAQQASDFLVRTRTYKKHASNFMISACQRWADRARAERWDVKGFRRNFNLPRSMMSFVLFDTFLGIGEEGFNCRPTDSHGLKTKCTLGDIDEDTNCETL